MSKERVVIGSDRYMVVPDSLKKLGVQYDHNVNSISFDCPRYSEDGIDMSEMNPFVTYMKTDGSVGMCACENINHTDDRLYFDWPIKRDATAVNGSLACVVCIKKADDKGVEENHWNSEMCSEFFVNEGLDCTADTYEKNKDIITQLLTRMTRVELLAKPNTMQKYVNSWLDENQTLSAELSLKKNYVDLVATSSRYVEPLVFNSVAKTLDIMFNSVYFFYNGKRYTLPEATGLSYDIAGTKSVILVYNTENDSYRFAAADRYTSEFGDVIILTIASNEMLPFTYNISTKIPYSVDGIVYNRKAELREVNDLIEARIVNKFGMYDSNIGTRYLEGYINAGGGFIFDNISRCCTDYILCPENVEVSFVGETDHENICAVAFYDVNKMFISGVTNIGTKGEVFNAISPKGTYFVRLSTTLKLQDVSYVQINSSAIPELLSDIAKRVENVSSAADIHKYVSYKGNDANDGNTKSTPYKTITKALSEGATVITIRPGEYFETVISDTPKHKLHINCSWEVSISAARYKREKAVFNCGEELTFTADAVTGLSVSPYECVDGDIMDQVFVSKTLDIQDSTNTRSVGYNVNLWSIGTDVASDIKFTPVLTLDECSAAENTWFYDGTNIYVNAAEGTYVLSAGKYAGITIKDVSDLALEDVEVNFARTSGIVLERCNNARITDCGSNYSGLNQGFNVAYVNGVFDNCYAHRNRNDGFNLHYWGNTIFNNCHAYYNYDDGISHHEGCTGSINGGYFFGNGKGGVSPAHGAEVDCYNVISVGNAMGFYYVCDDDVTLGLGKRVRMVGCVAKDNTYGIYLQNAHLSVFNCKYSENDTAERINSENEHTSLTVL